MLPAGEGLGAALASLEAVVVDVVGVQVWQAIFAQQGGGHFASGIEQAWAGTHHLFSDGLEGGEIGGVGLLRVVHG